MKSLSLNKILDLFIFGLLIVMGLTVIYSVFIPNSRFLLFFDEQLSWAGYWMFGFILFNRLWQFIISRMFGESYLTSVLAFSPWQFASLTLQAPPVQLMLPRAQQLQL